MLGRRLRVRFIALLLIFVLVVLFYRRQSDVEPYLERAGSIIGGGSVLRPDGKEESPAPPVQEPQRPDELTQATTDGYQPPAATTIEPVQQTSEQSPSRQTLSEYNPAKQWLPVEAEDLLPHEQGVGRVTVEKPSTTTPNAIHWTKTPEHFSLSSTIQLPSGRASSMPKIQKAKLGSDKQRLALIRTSAQWNWEGYKDRAWGHDELRPVSGGHHDVFNAWGATLVDSLDSLWIMGLKQEFDDAVKAVENIDFTTTPRADIPVFETTIRYLGGLLAAYDVSGQQGKYRILLDKAVELGEVLYSAFDTPNRMPMTYYYWKPTFSSQPHRATSRVVLAELGSLSLEFTRLAQISGEPKFYDAVARVTDALAEWQNNTRTPGMWPTIVDASGCGKPAQIVGPSTLQQPLPEGVDGWEGGHSMNAGAPVQQESRNRQTQKEGQRQLKEAVAKGEAGVGKIIGHGDPILEGSLDDPTAKADLIGASMPRKRQIGRGADNSEDFTTRQHTSQTLDGNDLCQKQGLTSASSRGTETFTLGGQSDSTYEYLPKEWMLLGGQVEAYRDMYLASADTEIKKLIFKPMTPGNHDILISGDLKVSYNYTTGDYIERLVPSTGHLTCFAGGMFALGGVLFDRPEDVEIGKKLTDGCVWAYNSTATGIMPEEFTVIPCERADGTPINGIEKGCVWNETRYHEELDPYRDTRTKYFGDIRAPLTKALAVTQATSQTTSSPSLQTLQGSRDASEKERVRKRQLGDALAFEEKVSESPTPAVALPASTADDRYAHEGTGAAAETTASTKASGTMQTPDAPQPAAAAIYTPAAPLSHKDYVTEKISDERLPPGMTKVNSRKYILRPEAIESVFYLYRITGDAHWRDAGWAMYTSIQDRTRGVYGNTAIDDVTKSSPDQLDSMESFWLAETLKYFWLLFEDERTWSLDDWVLNTEAHFFKRPK
ncbi:glycoside hydrolase family 47 protein [Polychaeton citri CBS 116435]|uniref:alpha-1,2-Mannosidase n=1 Tax=Polychaeton citri CBS 116435 TaxID=1314669 RepID=A0A9P4QCX5_9PEZI|nr:glycoside hydrolase family 47 protein [Polychaeton citri CBS 116435]